MPFDALLPWCEALERQLDPAARLAHWIGHEPDAWQIEAFTTKATEVALRVGRQAGKTSVLAARAVEELHIPESLTICVAPAERQAKIIAREIGRQLKRTELVITRSTLTELEMSNGARVVALPSTSDTIRGYPSVSCLIIDECAFLQGEGGGEDLIADAYGRGASVLFEHTGWQEQLFCEAVSGCETRRRHLSDRRQRHRHSAIEGKSGPDATHAIRNEISAGNRS